MDSIGSWGPAAMQAGGTAMSAAGSFQGASATEASAARQKQAAEFAAQQLEQNALQQQAVGQRNAEEQRRQGNIINSNVIAAAAAGGGGASDPTIVNLIARNAGESAYRAAMAAYQGDEGARKSRMSAAAQRYGGRMAESDAEAAANSMRFKGISTAISGASSLFSKYNVNATGGGSSNSFDYGSSYSNELATWGGQ